MIFQNCRYLSDPRHFGDSESRIPHHNDNNPVPELTLTHTQSQMAAEAVFHLILHIHSTRLKDCSRHHINQHIF